MEMDTDSPQDAASSASGHSIDMVMLDRGSKATGAPVQAKGSNDAVSPEKDRSMLLDQGFNPKKYPDPLKPREQSKGLPEGVTAEDQERWLAMIAAAKIARDSDDPCI